mmetsp:Transcript_8312/g.19284  ORF Transcript_8312/g.19284 Transcript_8312/m.19284 type:complete len:109 (+) Transcript_8312:846-1172(+)
MRTCLGKLETSLLQNNNGTISPGGIMLQCTNLPVFCVIIWLMTVLHFLGSMLNAFGGFSFHICGTEKGVRAIVFYFAQQTTYAIRGSAVVFHLQDFDFFQNNSIGCLP